MTGLAPVIRIITFLMKMVLLLYASPDLGTGKFKEIISTVLAGRIPEFSPIFMLFYLCRQT